jgi:hypothetical protein
MIRSTTLDLSRQYGPYLPLGSSSLQYPVQYHGYQYTRRKVHCTRLRCGAEAHLTIDALKNSDNRHAQRCGVCSCKEI